MTSLEHHFRKMESSFMADLAQSKSMNEAVKTIRKTLSDLTDSEGEYIQSLSPAQARVAGEMLHSLKHAFGLVTALEPGLAHEHPTSDQNANEPANMLTKSVLGGGKGLLTGLVASGGIVGAGIGLLVGIGLELGELVTQARSPKSEATKPAADATARPHIDADEIRAQLTRAIRSIDATVARIPAEAGTPSAQPSQVAQVSQPDQAVAATLDSYSDLLEALQGLIGDLHLLEADIPKDIQLRSRQIVTALKRYGIQVKVFGQDDMQTNGDELPPTFEFEPNLNPNATDYVMLTPAFLWENQVLLAGRVLVPQPTN